MTKPDEELMQQLMSTFSAEAKEHVEALNRLFLELEEHAEQTGRQALLEDIFREAHSLKGAARAVDVSAVETVAHGIEAVFSAARQGAFELSAALFDLLYEALDQIGESLAILANGIKLEPPTDLSARLDAAAQDIIRGPGEAHPNSEPDEPAHQEEEVKPTPRASQISRSVLGLEESVRVSTRKLDGLMTHVEELLVSRIRTEQRLSEFKDLRNSLGDWQKGWFRIRATYDRLRRQPVGELSEIMAFLGENQDNLKRFWLQANALLQDFSKDSTRMSLVTEDLQEDIRAVRMLPVTSLFEGFKRMTRDLAREQGKQIELKVSGADTELDKKVIEAIKDPLMHILRNAIDHGIESPAQRSAIGKPAKGTIELSAVQLGNMIRIEIEDDGAGIDVQHIKKLALEKRAINERQAESLADDDLRLLVFQSGFSTAEEVTHVSGRGVGLDVVKTNIEGLNGLVDVVEGRNGGTKFSLTMPLTLSTSRVLLACTAGETFAIPTTSVNRIVSVDEAEVFTIAGSDAIDVRGRSISLVSLADTLGLNPRSGEAPADTTRSSAIILGAAEKRVAFTVDSLVGETEIVVKSLGDLLSRVRNVSGATILGSGQVVMILNVPDLIKSSTLVHHTPHPETKEPVEMPEEKSLAKKVLVVDDSITTRVMEKNILEAAGYRVTLARDGAEALELLDKQTFDIVISDIQMPRVDGFALTSRMRENETLCAMPIILVTALDSKEDRERGLDSGADAYLVKQAFDQRTLLETINQLI